MERLILDTQISFVFGKLVLGDNIVEVDCPLKIILILKYKN